jgi:hypothetical protein
MSARAIAVIAPRELWPLAGDQLFVDLDLSTTNLPPGTRLALGAAVIEISAVPHNGCAKFTERFGSDATKWVNSPLGRELHLRGINARIVTSGVVRRGFSADLLHGVFSSPRGGSVVEYNLYAVSRASDPAPWGTLRIIDELNSAVDERDGAIDDAGTTLLFGSNRTGDSDIYITTRATPTTTFEPPVPLTAINTPMGESDPWISPDGRTIVFTRALATGRDIFIAEKNGAAVQEGKPPLSRCLLRSPAASQCATSAW